MIGVTITVNVGKYEVGLCGNVWLVGTNLPK